MRPSAGSFYVKGYMVPKRFEPWCKGVRLLICRDSKGLVPASQSRRGGLGHKGAGGGQAPWTLYHIMAWSTEGVKLFRNRKDREDFLEHLPRFG